MCWKNALDCRLPCEKRRRQQPEQFHEILHTILSLHMMTSTGGVYEFAATAEAVAEMRGLRLTIVMQIIVSIMEGRGSKESWGIFAVLKKGRNHALIITSSPQVLSNQLTG